MTALDVVVGDKIVYTFLSRFVKESLLYGAIQESLDRLAQFLIHSNQPQTHVISIFILTRQ